MASKVEICNLAIGHLGVGKDIANIDTENSEEARSCRRFFDVARDITLRDFAWSFAQKRAALNLIEQFTSGEWTYSYRMPSDCIKARRILSGIRTDTRETRVSFEVLSDPAGLIIYTDAENAVLEYTARITNTQIWHPDFVMAFSYRLAMYLAPRLAGGDPFGLRNQCLQLYLAEVDRARISNLNENQVDDPVRSELEKARD